VEGTCLECGKYYKGTEKCPHCGYRRGDREERSRAEATERGRLGDAKILVWRHIRKGDFVQWMAETVGLKATLEDKDGIEVLRAVEVFRQRQIDRL
jgi:hypothetical protein